MSKAFVVKIIDKLSDIIDDIETSREVFVGGNSELDVSAEVQEIIEDTQTKLEDFISEYDLE